MSTTSHHDELCIRQEALSDEARYLERDLARGRGFAPENLTEARESRLHELDCEITALEYRIGALR